MNQNRCYGLVLERKSWTEARTFCNALRQGYDLAIIKDSFTNTFIKGEITKLYEEKQIHKYFWIGLKDHPTEDKYVWRDGTSLTYGIKFDNPPWLDSEPNEVNNYHNISILLTNDVRYRINHHNIY